MNPPASGSWVPRAPAAPLRVSALCVPVMLCIFPTSAVNRPLIRSPRCDFAPLPVERVSHVIARRFSASYDAMLQGTAAGVPTFFSSSAAFALFLGLLVCMWTR